MVNESRPSVTTANPEADTSPARVLSLLENTGNQRVLVDWLAQQSQYETVTGDFDTITDADFDILILDENSLYDKDSQVRKLKEDKNTFLPILLVSSDTTVDTIDTRGQTETEREASELVDEIVTTPIENAALKSRLDTLARIRTQSIELERTTDQLLLLNRITRHDIRNEMSIVMGWTEQLEKHTDDEGDQIRNRVLESSKHVVALTRAIREFIQTLQTDTDPELKPVDLSEVLTDELRKNRSAFEDAEFVVTGEIPEVDVLANDLLASVFRNLLNNAVEHNEAETPRVDITVVERDETVVVKVADNGPGIPPDKRDAVLGRTEQGLDHPAAGLGLYLVDTLVDQYDGNLQISDSDSGGAAIDLELQRESATGSTGVEEPVDEPS